MRKLLLLSIIVMCSIHIFSQGLNNEQQEFDEQDAKNIASLFLGINTYKFDVNATSNNDLDILFEEFENGELKSSSGVVSKLVEFFGVNPIERKNREDYIRFYIKDDLRDNNMVDIRAKYLNLSLPKRYSNLGLSVLQTRAFGNITPGIEEKTPAIAIYGNKKSEMIGCPGDAKPEDIVKLYDWVCIIYLKKLEIE